MPAGVEFGRRPIAVRPFATRRGLADPTLALMIASLVIGAGLVAALASMARPLAATPPLLFHCAAVFRPAMEHIVADYQREHGVRVDAQYGGSGTLLGSIQVSAKGDLFMPADQSYLQSAQSDGLVDQATPVVVLTPVLAVAAGNPHNLSSLDDLLRPGLRIGFADPDGAAIGRITREALREEGLWERVRALTKVLKPTVSEIATDLSLGAIDATVLWDQTAATIDAIDGVRTEALSRHRSAVAIGVLAGAQDAEQARRFAAYVAGPGLDRFREFGYSIEGKP